MFTRANKTHKDSSQSVANQDNQRKKEDETTFLDNWPEAIAQSKIQQMANNSSQVFQMRAYQNMANNSSTTNQTIQLQKDVKTLINELTKLIESDEIFREDLENKLKEPEYSNIPEPMVKILMDKAKPKPEEQPKTFEDLSRVREQTRFAQQGLGARVFGPLTPEEYQQYLTNFNKRKFSENRKPNPPNNYTGAKLEAAMLGPRHQYYGPQSNRNTDHQD